MIRKRVENALVSCLLLTAGTVCSDGYAKPQQQQAGAQSPMLTTVTKDNHLANYGLTRQSDDAYEPAIDNSNSIGVPLLKNLISDQKAIWTSPAHLRWADGSWLFPLAAVTGGFLASDRAVPPALSSDPKKLNRYTSFSNYGVYSLVGAGGGLYLWSKISHDDHQRETGILAGEAAIDSFAVGTAFKYAFGRERPNEGQGLGKSFERGVSFPSDHSAVAWSIASVIAHEYPGTFTQMAVYGLATAVSASRVVGKQHFPSDVVIGGAIGWLIGRQIYRAHHDTELGGGGWDSLSGNDQEEEHRDHRNMGSTFVPLDSWVYAAFERLAALRYVNTEMMGMKPWTRVECARLAEEAEMTLQQDQTSSDEASSVQSRLAKEFAYEFDLLGGGRNLTAKFESVYLRAISISGPPLTDGYHFGQSVSYDFGRPFERGTNGEAGGSFSAAAGPMALYVRAEYQHAPSAPALSDAVRNVIAASDGVNLAQIRSGGLSSVNRPRLLDAYVTVNLNNWQLVLGKQSLSWAPGTDSMTWSNNIEPVNMVRLVNPEPFYLPGLLEHLGPIRIDQFFGRLEGHSYVPRPFEYGNKVSVKPFSFLELGFGRTVTIGGTGGDALTAGNLLRSFVGVANHSLRSVPGDSHSEMDWTFYVPKVRKYIVLYGDAYAEDDILPVENPPRNPWHPGLYLTHVPGISKLDFHIQGVSTEGGTIAHTDINRGLVNYAGYPSGYTNGGNLIGNTVGRDGRAIKCWFTYWISPQDTLRLLYQHNTVSSDFIPRGGAWQDYGLQSETHIRNGIYVKTTLQYEHISSFPILFHGQQNNITAIVEVGFSPKNRK